MHPYHTSLHNMCITSHIHFIKTYTRGLSPISTLITNTKGNAIDIHICIDVISFISSQEKDLTKHSCHVFELIVQRCTVVGGRCCSGTVVPILYKNDAFSRKHT